MAAATAALKRTTASERTETIVWHQPSEQMPDAEISVLCRWPDGEFDPDVWFGYTDGEKWFSSHADEMPAPIEWADSPVGSGRQ